MAIFFQTISKDPLSVLDYTVDWTAWLAPVTDTISTAIWIIPADLVQAAVVNTTTTATIWLGGGVIGKTYSVICRMTTVGGRTEDQSFKLFCEEH